MLAAAMLGGVAAMVVPGSAGGALIGVGVALGLVASVLGRKFRHKVL